MSKQIFSILLDLTCCMAIDAKEPDKGYRGVINLNMEYGTFDASTSTLHYMLQGLSTSDGYQFNPHLFLGVGTSIQTESGDVLHRLGWPLFVQGRTH